MKSTQNPQPVVSDRIESVTLNLTTPPISPFPESLNQWIDHIANTQIIQSWHRQDDLSYL